MAACRSKKFYTRDEILKEVVRNGEANEAKEKTRREDLMASTSFKASDVFCDEARLWLTTISRRLSGRRTIRNPFFSEISRDIPYQMFAFLMKLVNSTPEYCPPFCYHALVLLSPFSADKVAMYFKRTLATGSRRGHKVSVITSDEKDFAFIYKHRQGKLVISFYFGEWNASGFQQHVE